MVFDVVAPPWDDVDIANVKLSLTGSIANMFVDLIDYLIGKLNSIAFDIRCNYRVD